MNDAKPVDSQAPIEGKKPYEPPGLIWREPYEVKLFALSCAKDLGNSSCSSGPLIS